MGRRNDLGSGMETSAETTTGHQATRAESTSTVVSPAVPKESSDPGKNTGKEFKELDPKELIGKSFEGKPKHSASAKNNEAMKAEAEKEGGVVDVYKKNYGYEARKGDKLTLEEKPYSDLRKDKLETTETYFDPKTGQKKTEKKLSEKDFDYRGGSYELPHKARATEEALLETVPHDKTKVVKVILGPNATGKYTAITEKLGRGEAVVPFDVIVKLIEVGVPVYDPKTGEQVVLDYYTAEGELNEKGIAKINPKSVAVASYKKHLEKEETKLKATKKSELDEAQADLEKAVNDSEKYTDLNALLKTVGAFGLMVSEYENKYIEAEKAKEYRTKITELIKNINEKLVKLVDKK